MRKDQEGFEDKEKEWEDVLAGHPEILPDDMDHGVAGGLSLDDDIIDLVDVVREGDVHSETDMDDLSLLFDQEEPPENKENLVNGGDEDLGDFSMSFDETTEKDLESGFTESEDLQEPFDSPDFDFETPDILDEPIGEGVERLSREDHKETPEEHLSEMPEPETPGQRLDEMKDEDLDLAMAGIMEDMEDKTSALDVKDEHPPPFSQERLEAVVTHVVTEVVERVVRQTVSEAAEKVIREAIESLRQSLEPRPE